MMKFRFLQTITTVIVVMLMFTGCGMTAADAPELLDPVGVSEAVGIAAPRDIYELKVWEARVVPRYTELAFSQEGRFDTFHVSPGQQVEEGTLLASLISDRKYYDELCEQLTDMQLDNETDNRLDEIDMELQKMAGRDVSRQELLHAQTLEMQALEEGHLKELIQREAQHLTGFEIEAPESGTVVALASLLPGDSVSEGYEAVVLANDDSQYVAIEYMAEKTVNNADRFYVLVGDKEYELTYLPYDEQELSTKKASGEDTFTRFQIEGGSPDLVGEYAQVCRVYKLRKGALSVPRNSVYSEGLAKYVYRIDNGVKTKCPVTVGVQGTMYVEITEGLEEGAQVYVRE